MMPSNLHSEQQQTAVQVFTETYKQAQSNEKTYGLLRKARRLDEVIAAPRFDAVPTLDPSLVLPIYNRCVFCSTEFSPYWWPTPDPQATNGSLDADVKVASGEGRVSSSSGTSDAMAIDGAERIETEVEGPPPKDAVCHTCYFQRMQERGQQVTLDLNSPILVT